MEEEDEPESASDELQAGRAAKAVSGFWAAVCCRPAQKPTQSKIHYQPARRAILAAEGRRRRRRDASAEDGFARYVHFKENSSFAGVG